MKITQCIECGSKRSGASYRNYGDTGLCRICYHKSMQREGSVWYKRGWYVDTHGYKFILLDQDDFFLPMTDGSRYIREHRLFMARTLGRCLHWWEHVHHKNGDRLDNRIENLELTTQSQHHKDHALGYRDGFKKGLADGRRQAEKESEEWLRTH